jgi:nucleoside phosphorylase/CheY-like chemotaxis protein
LDNTDIRESDIEIVNCTKDARKLLYKNHYDLLILDLVLPIEAASEANAKNGIQFLEDIDTNPQINPPIHIVGLSGYSDIVNDYHEQFASKLWNLIDYKADSTGWHDKLKSIIFHLVRTRQKFIQSSFKQPHFCDVAIITALPHPELDAVLKLNNSAWEEIKVDNDFVTYYKSVFKEGDKVKTIIAATADQMGMTASSHLVTKMILYFKPVYVIMSGIAAGIQDRELGYGDILIAEQSWDYGSGKIIEKNKEGDELSDIYFEPDTRNIQLSSDLKAKISNFKLRKSAILDTIQNSWQADTPNTKLKMHMGPIASGSYVISSETTLSDIKTQQRKLLGVEMETFGVYYAAEHSPEPKTKAISIKSVSDYGDGTKNDKYQKYAAYTSANFIYHFILSEL